MSFADGDEELNLSSFNGRIFRNNHFEPLDSLLILAWNMTIIVRDPKASHNLEHRNHKLRNDWRTLDSQWLPDITIPVLNRCEVNIPVLYLECVT